jgi:hypothetical protein
MAELARVRLIDDLAAERQREQVIFGTEPLVDMMELSGYALLMSEVNGEGIWPDVREMWDRILSTDTAPALARQLAALQPGQVRLASSFDPLPDGGEPVVPGRR